MGEIFVREKEELYPWSFLALSLSNGREYECEEILRLMAKMRHKWLAKVVEPPAAFLMSAGVLAAVRAARGQMLLYSTQKITAFGVQVECMKAGESLCGAHILLVGDFVRRRGWSKVKGHSVGFFTSGEMLEGEKTQASFLKVDASNGYWTVLPME